MNVLSFAKPVHELMLIFADDSVAYAIDVMTKAHFSSVPLVDRDLHFLGTITEGDLLRFVMKSGGVDRAYVYTAEEVDRCRDYSAVEFDATILDLVRKATTENFVPVVDKSGRLMGIVTRKTLLDYFFEHNFIVL